MALAEGRVAMDRIQGGVYFCCKEGHSPFLADIAQAMLAEVFWSWEKGLAMGLGTTWEGVGWRLVKGTESKWGYSSVSRHVTHLF